ncbi:hypothetical protein LTS18_000360, partial [Coniosporium uncinatum]
MFQRLTRAIDSAIQEQSQRERGSQSQSPSRASSSAQRPNTRRVSPSRRPARRKESGNEDKAQDGRKGPDPATFEPEFVIGDDDTSANISRAGTPMPKSTSDATATPQVKENGAAAKTAEGETQEVPSDSPAPAAELSPEVQSKLRRLEKLEPKYY